MKNKIGYFTLAICFILVTSLGLGPAVFSDGSTREKIIIFTVVGILYIAIASCFEYLRRQNRKVK